jgi:quinol monooxygenase YgiN
MIRLTLTIETSPGESSRLLEVLRSLMEPTRASAPQLTFALTTGTRGLDYVAETGRDLTRDG